MSFIIIFVEDLYFEPEKEEKKIIKNKDYRFQLKITGLSSQAGNNRIENVKINDRLRKR